MLQFAPFKTAGLDRTMRVALPEACCSGHLVPAIAVSIWLSCLPLRKVDPKERPLGTAQIPRPVFPREQEIT